MMHGIHWGQACAIMAGGALGSLLRILLSHWVTRQWSSAFPWGTLCVNVLGGLFIGFLSAWLMERFTHALNLHAFILSGFLGGMTTFSTFSLETFTLIRRAAYSLALSYSLASVFLSIFAVFIGYFLMRICINQNL